tara:strand:- start:2009 stop:2464 length:456 start_codon:yes stop_codon:yes gene_type:complete
MRGEISKIMILSASAVYIIRILNIISLKNETKAKTKAKTTTDSKNLLPFKTKLNNHNCEHINNHINCTKTIKVTNKQKYYVAKNILAKKKSENSISTSVNKRHHTITKYNPYKQIFTPDVFINAANYLQKINKKDKMIKPTNQPTVSAESC